MEDHPGRDPGPEGPRRPSAQATPVTTQVTELEVYVGDPNGPSLSEQRFFTMYGQHGVQLLKMAEGGRDPEAEYRLGVLLGVDDRPKEALAFLMRAEAGGHPKARELIESPAQRRAALVHAWKIGTVDAADGSDAAALYLERAARNGHAGAAFELGALHMEREDAERAAAWFATAAECGHPLAEWWSDRNRQAALTDQGPGSMPTVDELMARLYGDPPAGLFR
jgi:TPR repeat protein